MMFEKILVAVDSSQSSVRALEAARELAALSNAPVRVVHVQELSIYARAGIAAEEGADEGQRIVDDAVALLTRADLKASGVLRRSVAGHVAAQVLEEAEGWGASVIVMASRGLSDLGGIVLGSTTHKILHLGNIPVLVVR